MLFTFVFHRAGYLDTALAKIDLYEEEPKANDTYKSWDNCLSQLNTKYDIAFIGDSITANGNFQSYFKNQSVINLGCYGDRILNVRERVSVLNTIAPKKIFLMIGINSLACRSGKYCIDQYSKLLHDIFTKTSCNEVYVLSVLPCVDDSYCPKEKIRNFNSDLEDLCKEQNINYIDLYSLYCNSDGYLPASKSYDGLHLNQNEYNIFYTECKKYF